MKKRKLTPISKLKAREIPSDALDVLALVNGLEPRGDTVPWIQIDFAKAMPAVVDRIRQCLDEGIRDPAELVDLVEHPDIDRRHAARRHVRECEAVPRWAWDYVGVPIAETPPDRRQPRERARERVRLWMTRAIKNRVGPVALHWLDHPDYRI